MYDSRNNRGKRVSRRAPRPEADPLDRDYGYGYSDEGRPITGIEDGALDNPNEPIEEPKGYRATIDMSRQKAVKVCTPGNHTLEQDGEVGDEIPGHVAMSCRYCPFGQLVPANSVVKAEA